MNLPSCMKMKSSRLLSAALFLCNQTSQNYLTDFIERNADCLRIKITINITLVDTYMTSTSFLKSVGIRINLFLFKVNVFLKIYVILFFNIENSFQRMIFVQNPLYLSLCFLLFDCFFFTVAIGNQCLGDLIRT